MKSDNNLIQLLQKPQRARQLAWKQLVSGEALYNALKTALREDALGNALGVFYKEWASFAEYNPEEQSRWQKARSLIGCATRAAECLNQLKEEPDSAIAEVVVNAGIDDAWQRICVQTFVEEVLSREPIHSVRVPIAGKEDEVVGENGFVAHLLLELIPGTGLVAHHAIDAFNVKIDERFEHSMRKAWDAAKTAAQAKGIDAERYDGRWRVMRDGRQSDQATGRSASGGEAVGWYHALTRRVYDDRIVVLAEIGEAGQLLPVSGITDKTRAIIETRYLDTIVVPDPETEQAIQRVRTEEYSGDDIRVVVAANLAAAASCRSRLCDELIDYCDSLIETLNQMDWRGPQGTFVTVSDIAVPVRVRVTKREINPALGRADDLNDASDPLEPSSPAEPQPEPLNTPIDRFQSALYEQTDLSDSKAAAWNNVWPQSAEMVVIRAGPGGGKTLHTRQVVVKAALDLKTRLNAGKEELSRIDKIPFWLTFTRLADAELSEETELAILTALERGFPERIRLTPAVRNYLREMLPDNAWLVFDGLDELHTDEQLALITRRFRAMRDWTSPCCLTCRTNYYQTETLGREKIVEYELAPFRWNGVRTTENEIRSFVVKWFRSDPKRGEDLLHVLEYNFALRHQCRTPLLLTLTCLSHQAGTVTEHTTYTDLFRDVLNGLLRRKWRDIPIPTEVEVAAFGPITQEDSRVGFMQDLLPPVAYALIRDASTDADTGGGRNRFIDREVLKAMAAAPKDCRPVNPRVMIDWLLFKGILVKAGYEGGRVCYSFAHRALMEYLAAQHLKTDPNYIEIIRAGLTSENPHTAAVWRFILPPLVGSITDPTALIRELIRATEQNQDDSLDYTLQLTILTCLLESKSALRDEELRRRAFDVLLICVDNFQYRVKAHEWRVLKAPEILERICAASEKHYGRKETRAGAIWNVVSLVRKQDPNASADEKRELLQTLESILADVEVPAAFHWSALWALVGADPKEAVAAIIRALDHPSFVVRALAARSAAYCKALDAFQRLILMLNDAQSYARAAAATALGRLAQEQAISHLKPLATKSAEEVSAVREAAMQALVNLVPEDSHSLTDSFNAGLQDGAESVRCFAITGLAKTSGQEVWPTLVALLRDDPSVRVKEQAAASLGYLRVSNEIVINQLLHSMTSDAPSLATKCCMALLRNALDRARPQVEKMLATANEHQKAQFVFGLKEAAKEDYRSEQSNPAHYQHAAELCIELTRDENVSVRAVACWALTFVMRMPGLRNDTDLNRRVAEQALTLMADNKPKVRAMTCSLFDALLRLRSPVFDDTEYLKDFTEHSVELLSDEVLQVRVRAVDMLLGFARTRPRHLQWHPSISKRLIETALAVLATATPQIKTNATKDFSSLIKTNGIENDEDIRKRLLQWGLELFSYGSPKSTAVSLEILTQLADGRPRRNEERTINVIVDKTMELLSDANNELISPALRFLGTAVVQPAWGVDDKRCRRIAETSLALVGLSDAQLKINASWTIGRLAEFRPTVLLHDDAFAKSVHEELANWLWNSTHQVRANALYGLKSCFQQSDSKVEPEFIRRLANQCTHLLNDRLDAVKANALNLLAILVRDPALRKNKPARNALANQCQALLISSSGEVRAAAANTLKTLLELGSESEGKSISDTTLESIVNLLNSPQQKMKELGLFNAVNLAYPGSPLLKNKRISRIVADRSLRMLDDSAASVQSSVLMVLEKILTNTNLNQDEQLTRSVVDRCIALLDTARPALKAAAIRILESLVNETELVSDRHLAEQLTQRALKLFEEESDKVKGTIYGILKVIAERNLLASVTSHKERMTLVRNGLLLLDSADSGLRASVLIVLGKLLTKSTLNQDAQLNREVANRTLPLVAETEPEEIRTAALRALEEILTSTSLRKDSRLREEVIHRAMELTSDPSIRVRKTALLAVAKMIDPIMDQKVLDDGFGLKIIEQALSAMEDPDLVWPACWILRNSIRIGWAGFIQSDDLVKRALDQTLKLLDSPNPFARTNAPQLLAEMIKAELSVVVDDDQIIERVVKRTLELTTDPNRRVRETSMSVLSAIVSIELESFLSDEISLRRAFNSARAMSRVPDLTTRVQSNIFVIFQVLCRLPERHEDNTANRTVVTKAIQFLEDTNAPPILRRKACGLLGELVRAGLSILNNDYNLGNRLANACRNELIGSSSNIADDACWVLVEMSRAQIPGLIGDQQLVASIREVCEILSSDDNGTAAPSANTLLLEFSPLT